MNHYPTKEFWFLVLLGIGLPFAARCQDDLYMLGTTIPIEADRWYQKHQADSSRPAFSQVFAHVYSAPDTNGLKLGDLAVTARWEPYLHFSWDFRSADAKTEVVWREDVGDWGYGINQFVLDAAQGWVRLPPGPFGAEAWVRVVSYAEGNGFGGTVYSVVGNLLALEDVQAKREDTGAVDSVSGGVLIERIDDGVVRFRPEIPSDMPCGEDVAADPPMVHFIAPVSHFLTKDRVPKFRPAYPKGC